MIFLFLCLPRFLLLCCALSHRIIVTGHTDLASPWTEAPLKPPWRTPSSESTEGGVDLRLSPYTPLSPPSLSPGAANRSPRQSESPVLSSWIKPAAPFPFLGENEWKSLFKFIRFCCAIVGKKTGEKRQEKTKSYTRKCMQIHSPKPMTPRQTHTFSSLLTWATDGAASHKWNTLLSHHYFVSQ